MLHKYRLGFKNKTVEIFLIKMLRGGKFWFPIKRGSLYIIRVRLCVLDDKISVQFVFITAGSVIKSFRINICACDLEQGICLNFGTSTFGIIGIKGEIRNTVVCLRLLQDIVWEAQIGRALVLTCCGAPGTFANSYLNLESRKIEQCGYWRPGR